MQIWHTLLFTWSHENWTGVAEMMQCLLEKFWECTNWRLRTFIWIKSYDGGRSECRNLKIPAFEFQTLILKLFLFFCVLTVMLFLLDFLSSQLLILLWNRKRQVGYFIELAWLSALLVWAETPSTEKVEKSHCLFDLSVLQTAAHRALVSSVMSKLPLALLRIYQNKTEIWCLWYSRERPQALCGQALCSLTFYWAHMCTSIHKLD